MLCIDFMLNHLSLYFKRFSQAVICISIYCRSPCILRVHRVRNMWYYHKLKYKVGSAFTNFITAMSFNDKYIEIRKLRRKIISLIQRQANVLFWVKRKLFACTCLCYTYKMILAALFHFYDWHFTVLEGYCIYITKVCRNISCNH